MNTLPPHFHLIRPNILHWGHFQPVIALYILLYLLYMLDILSNSAHHYLLYISYALYEVWGGSREVSVVS